MKFKKDFLIDELDLPYSAIEDKVIDNSRWSIQHEIVFEHEGKFYRTYYSVGATESQDEGPWEYDDEVDCTEVVKQEITVMAWVPVKEAE
jgi:hypothetical protein